MDTEIKLPLCKIRILRNIHGSAEKACQKWLEGSFWGNPIIGQGKIHIYGLSKKNWKQRFIEFTNKKIVVMAF